MVFVDRKNKKCIEMQILKMFIIARLRIGLLRIRNEKRV